ncbi:MAG: DmsC/YnfH family molybdoenzyme membrane anchor subunit [Sulfolobales archaeon]|nr:DmsC/YnfH family molybdoenzyme membrane anchor subunit [Sulfolobales archaeon]
MGLFTSPPNLPFGVQAPLVQINEYPLWGEYVALALFFTELAGMLMAILGVMEFTGKYRGLPKLGAPVVVVTAILAFAFFAMDLGRPYAATSAPVEALANFSHSWMARGIIFVSGLLLFGILYTIAVYFSKVPLWLRVTFSTIAMLFGIFSTVYSGFEFAAAPGVPMWNSGAIPLLFLAGGVFVGAGVAYILSIAVKGDEGVSARRTLAKLITFAGIAELASWFLYLATLNTGYVFNEVGYAYLTSQATFYVDLVISALAVIISGGGYLASVPLGSIFGKSKAGEAKVGDLPSAVKYAIVVAAIFAIVAAYLTRADVLIAGQIAYQTAPMTPFQTVSNQPIPIGAFGWRG